MKYRPRVLFFSTGDATRSRMAAAFLRRMTDELETESTAVKSAATNDLAEEVMSEIGVDLSKQTAKPVAQSLKEQFSLVVTLSDDSKERSPVWPFTRNIVHWNLPDPAMVEGALDARREAFRRLREDIHQRIRELVRSMQREERPRAIEA
jgi:arsenate reductase (thioredoxin)